METDPEVEADGRLAKCCRCKNIHAESDRVFVRSRGGWKSSRCPRCNGESYVQVRQVRVPLDGGASARVAADAPPDLIAALNTMVACVQQTEAAPPADYCSECKATGGGHEWWCSILHGI